MSNIDRQWQSDSVQRDHCDIVYVENMADIKLDMRNRKLGSGNYPLRCPHSKTVEEDERNIRYIPLIRVFVFFLMDRLCHLSCNSASIKESS